LKHDLPLTPYVRAAFWGGSEKAYSDFLTYEESQALETRTTVDEAENA